MECTKNIKIKELSPMAFSTDFHFSEKETVYMQMFDNFFTSPPSEKYRNIADIKGKTRVRLSFRVESDSDGQLEIFFMEYDEGTRIISTSKYINIAHGGNSFNLDYAVNDKTLTYKLAFRYYFKSNTRLVFVGVRILVE